MWSRRTLDSFNMIFERKNENLRHDEIVEILCLKKKTVTPRKDGDF